MSDLSDFLENNKILSGHFPTEILRPLHNYPEPDGDFDLIIQKETDDIRKESNDVVRGLLFSMFHAMKMYEDIYSLKTLQMDCNCITNSGCSCDSLNKSSIAKEEALSLYPAVTSIDGAIWFFAVLIEVFRETNVSPDESNDSYNILVQLCYLLRTIQNKERISNQTIQIDAIDSDELMIKVLLDDSWDDIAPQYLQPLTENEASKLEELYNKREELFAVAKEEKNRSKKIAARTEDSWHKFLRVLNQLSAKESNVIEKICDQALLAQDKLKEIENYNHYLDVLDKEKMCFAKDVYERFNSASYYCSIMGKKEKPVKLTMAAFVLALYPTKTWNYLFILYHQFRLSLEPKVAIQFLSSALEVIRNNLDVTFEPVTSFDEMLYTFVSSLHSFIKQNESVIETLSFTKIQDNTADLVPGHSSYVFQQEITQQRMNTALTSYMNSQDHIRDLEKISLGRYEPLQTNEVLRILKENENKREREKEYALARQIVLSLNIIYLVSDTLRMVLRNKQLHSITKDMSKIEQYREKLCRIDDELIYKAYSHLSDEEIGMRAFREKTGIDAKSLSEQERIIAEEESQKLSAHNICLATNISIMKDTIEDIVASIESGSINQIMEKNKEIRKQIFRQNGIFDKDIVDFLDEAITKICHALTASCKREQNEFLSIKTGIYDKLGANSHYLPIRSIDTLTTAELLYGRYAQKDYAERGFDYSSISALYYQAFENAYNDLVWAKYADKINNMLDDGYTQAAVLTKMFPPDAKASKFFNKKRAIKVCSYGSFELLIKEIKHESSAPEFCEMFAKLCGYDSREEMFNDSQFITRCSDFASCFTSAKNNRNNASHGGSSINIEQCKADKRVILNNLERVRSDSIGLIQQLLYLLYKE